jgi:hypothetical protein
MDLSRLINDARKVIGDKASKQIVFTLTLFNLDHSRRVKHPPTKAFSKLMNLDPRKSMGRWTSRTEVYSVRPRSKTWKRVFPHRIISHDSI